MLHYVQGQMHQANTYLLHSTFYTPQLPRLDLAKSHESMRSEPPKSVEPTATMTSSTTRDHWSIAVQPEFLHSSWVSASSWPNQRMIRRATKSSELSFPAMDGSIKEAAGKRNFYFDATLSTSDLLLYHELAFWSSRSRLFSYLTEQSIKRRRGWAQQRCWY